jgi:septum formation topological specificity factor MinE
MCPRRCLVNKMLTLIKAFLGKYRAWVYPALCLFLAFSGWHIRGKFESANHAKELEAMVAKYEKQIQEEHEAFLRDKEERVKIVTKFVEVKQDAQAVDTSDCPAVNDDWYRVYNDAIRAAR